MKKKWDFNLELGFWVLVSVVGNFSRGFLFSSSSLQQLFVRVVKDFSFFLFILLLLFFFVCVTYYYCYYYYLLELFLKTF